MGETFILILLTTLIILIIVVGYFSQRKIRNIEIQMNALKLDVDSHSEHVNNILTKQNSLIYELMGNNSDKLNDILNEDKDKLNLRREQIIKDLQNMDDDSSVDDESSIDGDLEDDTSIDSDLNNDDNESVDEQNIHEYNIKESICNDIKNIILNKKDINNSTDTNVIDCLNELSSNNSTSDTNVLSSNVNNSTFDTNVPTSNANRNGPTSDANSSVSNTNVLTSDANSSVSNTNSNSPTSGDNELMSDTTLSHHLTGLTISPKKSFSIIKLWNDDSSMNLSEYIRTDIQHISIKDTIYKAHNTR